MQIILNKLAVALLCAGFSCSSFALAVPVASKKDPRIQRVMYDPDDVTQVKVAKGTSLVIMLEPGEQIVESTSGILTDCTEKAEWCIVANKGADKIWVKSYSTGEWTDLQLSTVKGGVQRMYSFALSSEKLPKQVDAAPTFRIVFDYPAPPPPPIDPRIFEPSPMQLAAIAEMQLKSAIDAPKGKVRRNTNYTMQMVGDSSGIAPSETFDDGRFTYLKFPNNRDVPAVFTVDGKGMEKQVTKFWEKGTDYMVIEKVYPRLILRKDKLTIGIWNEAYDPEGVAPKDGTTVDSVKRVVK